MTAPIFNFTRVPSVKVTTKTVVDGLVTADNELLIIGRKAASGGSVAVGTPVYIDNYGDPVAAETECTSKFGASSEIGEMVVAAIKGVLFSDNETKVFPKLRVVAQANDDDSSDLAALLANLLTLPAPFIVVPYPATDSAAMTALKNHCTAISANDRGLNGQFGSFAFLATDAATGTATPAGTGAATENICIPWLRDGAVSKANKIHAVASAYAALCAGLGLPFMPLDGVRVGGLVAPATATDWHTAGDTGTAALGLSAGLVPLMISAGGDVLVSRSITTRRVVASVEDTAYFDMQDWQVLYYLRKNCYNLAMQPQYRIAKASVQKLQALRSDLIKICKQLEELEMLQFVDKFVDQFTVDRQATNRSAAVYRVPVNCIPGFHNKGIEIVGTTQFDAVVA